MTINKNVIKLSPGLENEVKLFLANSNLSLDQRDQLNKILYNYYNEGYQHGRVDIIMQETISLREAKHKK